MGYLEGSVEGVNLSILLDGGADVSLIDYDFFQSLSAGTVMEEAEIHVTGASNAPLTVRGRANVTVKFVNNIEFEQTVIVVENFKKKFLLGKDFLFRNGAIINYSKMSATFQKPGTNEYHETLKFHDPQPVKLVNSYKSLSVDSNSITRLAFKVSGDVEAGETIQFDGGWIGNRGLFLPCTVTTVAENKKAIVEVMNVESSSVELSCFEIVATGQSMKNFDNNEPEEFEQKTDSIKVTREDLDLGHLEVGAQMEIVDIINNSGVLSKNLGVVKGHKHHIKLKNETPINVRQYRLPIAKREEACRQVDRMLKSKVIRPSTSPWNSPVVLAPKADGTLRFAVDLRKLNEVTVKEVYPLPKINDTLNALGTGRFFTKIDLESAFWQLPLTEESAPKTAFSIEGRGHFEFVRLPFGLSNASSAFQRLMDVCMTGLTYTHMLCYQDDIIVYGSTIEEHNERLRVVLQRLADCGLTMKHEKCKFAQTEVKFLGHIIGDGKIKVNPSTTAAVRDFPRPKNVSETKSFLGLAGYYRRFVKNFSDLTKPLTELTKTKSGKPFLWNQEAERAFEEVKTALISPPCLTCLDHTAPLVVHCDASNVGLGAVLSVVVEGEERVVSYASRTLKDSEQKYAPIQKEALAIIFALKQFHYYLYGQSFTVVTDHCPLTYLKSMSAKSLMMQRWILIMSSYNFKVVHRAGSLNQNADTLSRCPISLEFNDGKEICPTYEVDQVEVEIPPIRDEIASLQDDDEQLFEIKQYLEGGVKPKNWREEELKESFIVEDGLLYHLWKPPSKNDLKREVKQLVVPQSMRGKVLIASHDDANHPGYIRTLARTRLKYYWPKMNKDVSLHVKNCSVCASIKTPKLNVAPLKNVVAEQVLDLVSIDLVGPIPNSLNGNRFILTLMDQFSRWPAAYPIPDAKAETILDCIKQFGNDFGFPRCLLSDRGKNLLGSVISRACRRFNIARKMTTSFHPQCNGMLERFHYTLKNALSTYPLDDWDLFVSDVVGAYRSTPHSETGLTPASIFLGREINVDTNLKFNSSVLNYGEDFVEDRVAKLARAQDHVRKLNAVAQAKSKQQYDKKAHSLSYAVGDWVWLREGDIDAKSPLDRVRWTGPYQIKQVLSEQNVGLALPNKDRRHPIVHVNRTKRDTAVTKEDVSGRIEKSIEQRKVRGLNGRLVNKSFVQLDNGFTLWVPTDWT